MSKYKLRDLVNTEEEFSDLKDEIDSFAERLGDPWRSGGGYVVNNAVKEIFGICYGCRSFKYCKTEFGNLLAKCDEFEIALSGKDRMTDCNAYNKRSMMTLRQMMDVAFIIGEIKPIKGFG